MAESPVTPSKHQPDKSAMSPHVKASGGKPPKGVKSKLTPLHEPSPASTYGETAGSSVPATPLDYNTHDVTAGIADSLRAAQLDPAIKSITASPEHALRSKHRATGTHVKFCDAFSSPSKGGASVEGHGVPSETSSPAGRAEALRTAPTWRGAHETSQGRVTQYHTNDPFISDSEEAGKAGTSPSESLTLHPSKIGVRPTNTTAQAIYSPQACVFVANLSQSETDEQLEQSVTDAFQQFGDVYVKIRRDSRQMPFAFAQFTNVDDAQRAISHGRGMLVNGRPCRTEVARVNRSLYLSKISGGGLTEAEGREVMKAQGPVEAVWSASQTEREMFGLPEGVFIRFAFFDDCRDALTHFRDSDVYRLEQVKGLEETRGTPVRGVHVMTSPYHRDSPGRFISPYSTRRNADSRSVFVGNIPAHLSEDHLLGMFQVYGRITQIEIVRKPSMTHGVNAFAFIEFDHPRSAAVAVQAGPRPFQGLYLRVEHKEASNSAARVTHGYGGSPRRKENASSPEILAAFQRGLSIGMGQAQAQMLPNPYYGQYPYYTTFDSGAAHPNLPATSLDDASGPSPPAYGSAYLGPMAGPYPYAPAQSQVNHLVADQAYLPSASINAEYQWPSQAAFDEHHSARLHASQEMQ